MYHLRKVSVVWEALVKYLLMEIRADIESMCRADRKAVTVRALKGYFLYRRICIASRIKFYGG